MKKLLAIMLLIFPALAQADELDNAVLKYEAHYGSMKAGEMKVVLNQSDGAYKHSADVKTNGLTKYVTKYWSSNRAEGKLVDDKYIPSVFETTFQPKKKARQNIIVKYGKDEVSEIANPPELRERRPLVENKDKLDVPDPITAVLIARERIRELVEKGTPLPYEFEQPVFDGRRVFLAKGQIVGYTEKKINGKRQKVLHLHGQRIPQAGFHPKELEKIKGTEPVFDIYLDTNYIPVLVEGQSSLGEGIITLVEKCSGAKCG